jgi:hypothetical protein
MEVEYVPVVERNLSAVMSSLEQDVQNGVDESDLEHRVNRSLVGFVADEFILIQYFPFLKDADDAE